MALTWDDIEILRNHTYRRTPARALQTVADVQRFIEEVGFCFAFKANNSELPCAWHAAAGERRPKYPHHSHHDPHISLIWRAKDELPAARSVYYGKALKNRPTFVALEYLPDFITCYGGPPAETAYQIGQLSVPAKRILGALLERSPQLTRELKEQAALAAPQNRQIFDRAMAELQKMFYIVKVAEFYEPFTFVWDVVPRQFPNAVAAAEKRSRHAAQQRLLLRYLQSCFVARIIDMERMFRWTKSEIETALDVLVQQKKIAADMTLEDARVSFFGMPECKTI